MDNITNVAQGTIAALMRDYYLWLGVLTLVLAFALYVYFFPTANIWASGGRTRSIDFFENPKEEDPRRRSESPKDDPHSKHTPVHEAP